MILARSAAPLSLAALVLLAPSVVGAAGAWRTYVRPSAFTDLIAEGDTVWCATRDAGLVRFTPSSRSFAFMTREPNGLRSNRLTSLALDRSRRLWMGTAASGASVLSPDRSRWSLVNEFDGLPSDSVLALAVRGDSVWIATARGLALWDGEQVAGVVPDGVNPSPFASDVITGVVETGDSVWVGTAAGVYLARLSQQLAQWTPVATGLASQNVSSLVLGGVTPFALANFAAHRWDAASSRWVIVGGIGAVRALSSDRGELFAGASTGLYRWNGTGWTSINAALTSDGNVAFAATVDDTGRVYAAGRPAGSPDASTNGVYREPDAGGAWSFDFPPGPPGNNCLNLEIQDDRLYVTTYTDGIARLTGEEWTYWLPGAVPTSDPTRLRRPIFVYAFLVDAEGLKWVFSWAPLRFLTSCIPDTGAIDVLDDSAPVSFVRHELLGPAASEARRSFARSSTLDPAGGRWFGMDSPCADQADLRPAGLEYYPPGDPDSAFAHVVNISGMKNDQVWSLVTDRNGRIWVGSNSGLGNFFSDSLLLKGDGSGVSFLASTDRDIIRALATKGDSLWVYTTSEVRQYGIAPPHNLRGSYFVPAGPAAQAVRPMDVGRDGTLWLGTANGIRAYHPSGQFEDFTEANSPLASDEVRTIRVDRRTGVVWAATAGGLSRFDPGFVAVTPAPARLSIGVYPNPARLTGLGLRLRLQGNATTYRGEIYDLSGRRVHQFSVPANGRVIWDGRDDRGDLVQPGIYFVRAAVGTSSAVARVVLLR